MFTGLIEALGSVRRVTPRSGGARLAIEAPFSRELAGGESVSVDGACLTVVASAGETFEADAVAATMERTTLGRTRPGSRVNLERALRMGDRLGGHFVAGHVDATSHIVSVADSGAGRIVSVALEASVARYVVPRGSIAIDGISLTVSEVEGDAFRVALIPETLERTTAGSWRRDDAVNLEADLLAKHIEALLDARAEDPDESGRGITRERLAALGFLERTGR